MRRRTNSRRARTASSRAGRGSGPRRAGPRAGGLEEYRRKRDFGRTPEPSGDGGEERSGDTPGRRFVIQKHAATRLHFDLRLERGGVLESWAVPKGPSLEPGEKRLAVRTEDHPLAYAGFEGVIPAGEYGGGTVMLWDEGRWREADGTEASEDRIDFVLDGRKLHGTWTLTRTGGRSGQDERNWLLIKRSDDGDGAATRHAAAVPSDDDVSVSTGRTMEQIAAERDAVWTPDGATPDPAQAPDPARLEGSRKAPLPREPKAQLATLAPSAPDGDAWLHEIKFDGYRILARWDGSSVRLSSRNGHDWTDRFPEIVAELKSLPPVDALLDGEVVALQADGSSSFRRLQEALSEERTAGLVYQVFDLLHLDGRDVTGVPLEDRKRALHGVLGAAGFTGRDGTVRYTDHLEGMGPAFLERACGMGLEGIISKRRDARYASGRNRNWLKAKCTRHQDLVIGGFTDPSGSRIGFGALLLGGWDGDGRLAYAGKVGTGFGDRLLERLHRSLAEIETETSPFDPKPSGLRGAHWVEPVLVAEVEFTEWTGDGSLRHPVFRGLREDKEAAEARLPSEAERSSRPRSAASRSNGTAAHGDDGETAGATPAGRGSPPRRKRGGKGDEEVAGVWLSSPDKILYPEQGVTKLALARYYANVAGWILPHVRDRPLSLVRCPQGREKTCFYQKHPGESMAEGVPRTRIEEKDGPALYLYVRELPDLIALVQAGVLELHVWGSRVADVERPDLLVFDLDPGPGVSWSEMLRVARDLSARLDDLGLAALPRTTGGKGLHLVVPLRPRLAWEEAKTFARAVAQAHAQDDPERVTTNMSKAKRQNKIFLDYLRNGRGATAIASYSTRSRAGAPVAVPVRPDELRSPLRPDRYDVGNLRRRLAALDEDPWGAFDERRRSITKAMMRAVGLR